MNYYINPNIKNTYRVFPRQGRTDYYRYDANENPEGLPKEFVDSVLKEITPKYLAMYPEPDRFLKKYAEFIGAFFENVYATNGSDHGIRVILETFGEPGKDVVTVSPTFEIYWVCCNLLGLNHKPVQYDSDLTISVDRILNAITLDTRIIVMLNPNSPIGNLYSEEDVNRVILRAKEVGAVVVLDEAYHYFYEKTFLSLALKNENVILLRTFSKLMSLAGCRIGVVIGCPEIVNFVKKSRLAYEMNSVGLLFAEKLLDRRDIIENLIQSEKEGKAYLIGLLESRHYWYMDCHGNYVLIKPKHEAHLLSKELEEKKILVHPYNNELMKDMIRVTTGSKKMMEIFANIFFEVDK